MIDLRRLRVLRAVAYHGTVTAAAYSLDMTTSAASHQIRQLGKELGVVLLEPDGRRIRLSASARTLLSHADAIEARWQQAEAELHGASAEPNGVLRMCGFSTAISSLLTPVAAALSSRWPALVPRIREAETLHCFELVFSDSADLAVVEATPQNPPPSDARYDQHLLLSDPFDLLVAPDHRLAAQETVSLSEVANEPWIVGVPDSSARQHALVACNSVGFTPNIAHEAHAWTAVATLVAHNLGVALVPRLAPLPPTLQVRRTPLTGRVIPARQFVTVTRLGGRTHPATAAALTLLDNRAATLQHRSR